MINITWKEKHDGERVWHDGFVADYLVGTVACYGDIIIASHFASRRDYMKGKTLNEGKAWITSETELLKNALIKETI